MVVLAINHFSLWKPKVDIFPLKKDAIDDTLNCLTFLRERIKKMKEEGKSIDEIRQALAENPFKDYKMYDELHNVNIFVVYNQLDYEED
jgi:cyclase